MRKNVTPIIHVPDVRATIEWYRSIGFEVTGQHEEDGVVDWARVEFGDGSVMFSEGGKPSDADRREVDLYLHAENIERIFEAIQDRVEVFEAPHDTFYGMREFIIRDINRFWITFAEEVSS